MVLGLALGLALAPGVGCTCRERASTSHDTSPGTAAPAPTPDAVAPVLWHRRLASPAEALALVLEDAPRVIGFGEFHQKKGGPAGTSSVARFTAELLPVLAALKGSRDIVLETWIPDGRCGEQEKQVVKQVGEVTKRPEQTEDELWALIKAAKQGGVTPHILKVGCEDYDLLINRQGVDYQKLLELIKKHLANKGLAVMKARAEGLLALYGGALHNDLSPHPDLASFSYGPSLDQAAGGAYVELDLLVPEYIRGSDLVTGEPWYPLFEKLASEEKVLLIRRAPRSYVLIYREGR